MQPGPSSSANVLRLWAATDVVSETRAGTACWGSCRPKSGGAARAIGDPSDTNSKMGIQVHNEQDKEGAAGEKFMTQLDGMWGGESDSIGCGHFTT